MSAHIKGRGYGTPSNEGAALMSVIGVQPLAPTYGILRESAISNPHVTTLSHLWRCPLVMVNSMATRHVTDVAS
jgi:hypothetical protein